MRWDGQTVEADEEDRLPGFADTAIVRRFDVPEALDTRFYEVRAKSALNRVPGGSRVPFRWTINPYRGCSHACVYCASGETKVLMEDGHTRPLADVRAGDAIYGTVRQGLWRRYAITEVLDHWTTVKPAYRVTLANGAELVTSGDHRFLTARGWKFVTGTQQGPARRQHLTVKNSLMGTSDCGSTQNESALYRQGYLCGLVRGDGHLRSFEYKRSSGRRQRQHVFRLAMTDQEALNRARRYLRLIGIETREYLFQAALPNRRQMHAIITQSPVSVARVGSAIEWPRQPAGEWSRGFLAGIFDAEGSYSNGTVRIANSDRSIIDRVTACCRDLGFRFLVERPRPGMWNVRIPGGLSEHLRLFQTIDPAISRKRSIAGRAVRTTDDLRVVSIEPLGVELPLYDITTGTGDFIGDGVIHHNCFARPTHEYLDFNAGRDFEKEIVVKVNVPEVLRKELARPSWRHEHVAMGTNTDPYQWVEGRYKLMRGIWAALRDAANPCSVLTKSPLLLRDTDLMLEVAERTEISACLSVPTLEEKAWRASEPHTPHPRARLEAVAKLNAVGIPTGVLIAPLLPGINDAPEQVEEIIRLATEAGAVSIGGQTLFLHGAVRDIYFDWLRTCRPDLVPRYERLYARGGRVPMRERRAIERAAGLANVRLTPNPERFTHRGTTRRPDPPPAPREEVRQESLF